MVLEELEEASMLVYLEGCPNCGGPISDSRLSAGLPCVRCLPRGSLRPGVSVYEALRELGTLRRYGELERAERAFGELVELFRRAVGSEPWGVQRLWLRRLSLNSSFAMLAPTGVGKTTLGIVAASYFAAKGGRSYVLVPTTLLVRQVEGLLEVYGSRLGFSPRILALHSRLGREERTRREEALDRGDFRILVTTSRYLMRNFERVKGLRFRYIFVDDVDAVMKGSRTAEMILRLMGFSERAISLGLELVRLRREMAGGAGEGRLGRLRELEEELRREAGGVESVLVVSSATGSSRAGPRLFRELLGFEVGARPELIRNVCDLYLLPERSLEEEVLGAVRSLGRGGLVFVPADRGMEYADGLAEFLRASGVRAEAVHSRRAGGLEGFLSGEVEVLVGVATYYGILVRGLDLPEHVRYAVFAGVPRHRVGLQVEELDVPDVLRLLPLLAQVVEDERIRRFLETSSARLRRAVRRGGAPLVRRLREVEKGGRPGTQVERVFAEALTRVRELVGDGRVLERLTGLPEVAVVREGGRFYVLIPDAPTYLQASGRTSRLYLGGISKGISLVIADDPRLLRGLERRLSWMVEDFRFTGYREVEGRLGEVLEEVDRDRELIRLVRRGKLRGEELSRLRGLEFKTSLLVVESPNKARTIAGFFGRPSVKEYGRLRVYEVSLGNRTILITATGGHVCELVTGDSHPGTGPGWRDLFGVAVRDGRYVPLYAPIKRCPGCGQQFAEPGLRTCPSCGSPLFDSLEVIEAVREVAGQVDEVLVGTDPDTEGEKIAYDIANAVRPFSAQVRRVEFHEVTRRALLEALARPREIRVDLVRAQLVRRVEDRWIGFSLSRLLQEGFRNRNLSAGRVQTPVLGWVIEAARRHRKTRRRYLSALVEGVEFVFELPPGVGGREVVGVEVEVCRKETEEVRLRPDPPFTTDTALSELSATLRMPVSRVMEVLQDLFEAGLITYHRTDSTRVSEAGRRVAEEYLRAEGCAELFVGRGWGEGGAHEAIRPTRPLDSSTLGRLIEEGVMEPAVRLRREHLLVYDAIFRRFLASQLEEAEVLLERVEGRGRVELRDGRVLELEARPLTLYAEVRKEGFLRYGRIRLRRAPEVGRYLAERIGVFSRSEQTPHTEATLVRRMKEAGIGRPSTYSKIVETILRRGYALRTGAGYLLPRPMGIEVYRYLTGRFGGLVSEERTRELEQKMDAVEQGLKEYSEVLAELHADLSGLGLVGA